MNVQEKWYELSSLHIGFHFTHIPQIIDQRAIKIFKNTKSLFSLEYIIFDPMTVQIHLVPISKGWFKKKKRLSRDIATIQQFASNLGIHPDLHFVDKTPLDSVLNILKPKFSIGLNRKEFFCHGVVGTNPNSDKLLRINTSGFTDNLLEILTDSPSFAAIQFVFQFTSIPKALQKSVQQNSSFSHLKFNLQEGKVEKRYSNLSNFDPMNELGCYKFSPRIIIVEENPEILKGKVERLSVLFNSIGLKLRVYPSLLRRFGNVKKIFFKRNLGSYSILDGFSLINTISLPQHHFAYRGYKIVPNKSEYMLSSNVSPQASSGSINLGIPILSGKTSDIPLSLSGKDLNRHMAVIGMTGEGKSRFTYGLIKEFFEKGVKFIIFDPKGEYIQAVQDFCTDFIYLKPGSTDFPWGINIFQTPIKKPEKNDTSLEDYIQFVVSVLENIFEENDTLTPQMRRLLHLAVAHTISNEGDFHTFQKFLQELPDVNIKGSYIENSAIALLNRFQKLLFGNNGRCFSVKKTTLEIEELLNYNIIIDLSIFEAMEDIGGKYLFIEVVLQNLFYALRNSRSSIKEETLPRNILVMDEVQKLLPRKKFWDKNPNSMITKGPLTLRSYDISMIFVGVDPLVNQSILANTGIIITFFTNYDPNLMANILGITRQEYEKLRRLLKVKEEERCFIMSLNGKVGLLKANDFRFALSSQLDMDQLKKRAIQQKIYSTYCRISQMQPN
ncbi:MAG: ATP-binding protein [Candidatus Hodarchaeales archaeon]